MVSQLPWLAYINRWVIIVWQETTSVFSYYGKDESFTSDWIHNILRKFADYEVIHMLEYHVMFLKSVNP